MNTTTLDHLKLRNFFLNQYRGRPAVVPNFPRSELPNLFVELGYKVGAEIGVSRGDYTVKFLDAGLKMYAVDAWIDIFRGRIQNQIRNKAIERLSEYPNCTVMYKTSMEAVKEFADGSLDFVYIDADHRFRAIAEDLVEWSKKVRSGGIVSGHDYYHRKVGQSTAVEVDRVVDAYAMLHRIKNWWVFGSFPESADPNDRYLSWMWFKR